jgi:hypothetical protein
LAGGGRDEDATVEVAGEAGARGEG